jgi:hypothetical protein
MDTAGEVYAKIDGVLAAVVNRFPLAEFEFGAVDRQPRACWWFVMCDTKTMKPSHARRLRVVVDESLHSAGLSSDSGAVSSSGWSVSGVVKFSK